MPLYIHGARASSLPRTSTDSEVDAREHRALHPEPTRDEQSALNIQASTTHLPGSPSARALETTTTTTTTTPPDSPPASALQNLTTTRTTTTPPGSPSARALQLLTIKPPGTSKLPATPRITLELTNLASDGQKASPEQASLAVNGTASVSP
ncbi:hypothetical protein LTS15_011095 [Exophiala xenobiotica]|nr:hypothetical protein LTS15_011095 [Exophiala xenobiotica]